MDKLASLRTRAIGTFRIAAMCVAILAKPLLELGLLGDAFVALAHALGSGIAIMCFAGLALYVLYGMMLTIYVAIVLATGLLTLLLARPRSF